MKQLLGIFIFYHVLTNYIDCDCIARHVKKHEGDKYKKEKNVNDNFYKWDKYLKQINLALESYKRCTSTNCSCYFGQIGRDLKPWIEIGISEDLIDKGSEISDVSHYQVIGHKLYRSEETDFPARNRGVEHFLLKIANKLPNVEFLVNLNYLPKVPKKDSDDEPIPIFSFSKIDAEHYDILFPSWAFWDGGPVVKGVYPRSLGRWDEHIKSMLEEAKKSPWDKRIEKAFFRGSRTSEARDPLILLSRDNPQLFDAKFIKNHLWRSNADSLGLTPVEAVKLEDHCKFKYLFSLPGESASLRFRHLFLCGSVVYHVGSDWIEFFYEQLKPWVHYIPVDQSLKNLEEIIEFAVENDEVARNLALRGKKQIVDHLKMDDITCYWEHLLKRYAKLLNYKVKRNKSFIQIKAEKLN